MSVEFLHHALDRIEHHEQTVWALDRVGPDALGGIVQVFSTVELAKGVVPDAVWVVEGDGWADSRFGGTVWVVYPCVVDELVEESAA